MMNPRNPLILGSKGQGHNVCINLQTERNIAGDSMVMTFVRSIVRNAVMCSEGEVLSLKCPQGQAPWP